MKNYLVKLYIKSEKDYIFSETISALNERDAIADFKCVYRTMCSDKNYYVVAITPLIYQP